MDNVVIYFIVHLIGGMLLLGFGIIMGVTIYKEIKKEIYNLNDFKSKEKQKNKERYIKYLK